MSREYVPKEVKPTGTTDQNGNMGYGVTFSSGEQAFLLAKKAPEVGAPEWGEILDVEKKGKPGETYKRFYRRQKDEQTSFVGGADFPKPKINGRDDNAIRAQWAIGQAIQLALAADAAAISQNRVEEKAKELFAMVDRVKKADIVIPPKADLDEVNLNDIPF